MERIDRPNKCGRSILKREKREVYEKHLCKVPGGNNVTIRKFYEQIQRDP